MEGTRIVVSVVIGLLGLLATILSFAAEGSRKTFGSSCDDIKYPLTSLGISAALVLLVTQIVANVCGGCVCYCTYGRPFLEGNTKMFAICCLALSWVAFVVGFALLILGSLQNGQETGTILNGYYDQYISLCKVARKGMMGGGGALAILSTGFAIAYYLLVTQIRSTSTNVVVGKPTTEMGPMEDDSTNFNQSAQLGPHA